MSATNRRKIDNKNDECSQRIRSYKNTRHGTPEGTRTPDLLIRSQSLYPTELLAHISHGMLGYYSIYFSKMQVFFRTFRNFFLNFRFCRISCSNMVYSLTDLLSGKGAHHWYAPPVSQVSFRSSASAASLTFRVADWAACRPRLCISRFRGSIIPTAVPAAAPRPIAIKNDFASTAFTPLTTILPQPGSTIPKGALKGYGNFIKKRLCC